MIVYIIIFTFTSFTFASLEQKDEIKDLKLIILKKGDTVRVNNISASLSAQPMIKFDLGFSDFDNLEFDVSDVEKVIDSKGNLIISKKKLTILNFFKKCFNLSTQLILCLLILDRFY